MAKASAIFSSFDNAALFDIWGDVLVDGSAGLVRLDNLDKVLIRAEDFLDAGGSPNHMPVIEYPAGSGKYVGNPDNGVDYYYSLPSALFGNYHMFMMEGLVPTTFTRPKDNIVAIYPRDGSYFQEKLTVSPNFHEFDMVDGGGRAWLAGTQTTNKKIYKVDSWFKWQVDCLGKYFMEVKIAGSRTGATFYDMAHLTYRGQYDGFLANATTPRGLFRTSNTQYIQGNSHFRSPGKEYETTTNPGIIQLYPFKTGYTFYKNSANKYLEFDADMVAAITAGTFELDLMTSPYNTSRYLCTVRIDSYIDFNPFYVLQVREDSYDFSDFIAYGGHIVFPDYPQYKPVRIVAINPVAGQQLWVNQDLDASLLSLISSDEVRAHVFLNTVVPVYTPYPRPVSNQINLPLPYSGDVYDIRGFQANPPSVGDKITLGVLLSSFDGVINENDRNCKELTYYLDPFPSGANVLVPTLNSLTNDLNGTSVTVSITPPATGDYTRTRVWYRDITRIDDWLDGGAYVGVQGVAGNYVLGSLTNNTLYAVMLEAEVDCALGVTARSDPCAPQRVLCSDDALPVIERILIELKATFTAITVANGFKHDIAQVLRIRETGLQTLTDFPSIIFYVPDNPKDDTQPVDCITNNAEIYIEGWIKKYHDCDTALSNFEADLIQAIMEDPTRGGEAVTTSIEVTRRYVGEEVKPHGYLQARAVVHYRHQYNNPYVRR